MDTGILILDRYLTLLAADRESAAMLSDATTRDGGPPMRLGVFNDVLSIVRNPSVDDSIPVRRSLRIGRLDYLCRAYRLHYTTTVAGHQPAIALHLALPVAGAVTIDNVTSVYHLTEREREVLSGLASMGLTNKELAARLNISSNTVKLFVRLLMIKMGVTTRAGLVAKLLPQPEYVNQSVLEKAM
jgi:DNA-binding CsgD family transcriptional regulator